MLQDTRDEYNVGQMQKKILGGSAHITTVVRDVAENSATLKFAVDSYRKDYYVLAYNTDENGVVKDVAAEALIFHLPQPSTIAAFAALEDGDTQYELTGTITSISVAYNSQYKNISFYFEDETGSIQAYRMSCTEEVGAALTVGDEITLWGAKGTYDETAQVASGSQYISHVDKEAPVSDADVVIDFSSMGYTNGEAVDSWSQEGVDVTVAFAQGSNSSNAPKYYDSGSAIRCYGGNTFTVASTKKIAKIELVDVYESSNAVTADVGAYADNVWTGEATSVTFTVDGTSGHKRLQKIEVTFAE